MNEDWTSAWAEALDALEANLDTTERLLQGEQVDDAAALVPWTPPRLRGPMPVDLRTRALELHHRQQMVLRATAIAAAGARKQAVLAGKLSSAPKDATPVYLDITA